VSGIARGFLHGRSAALRVVRSEKGAHALTMLNQNLRAIYLALCAFSFVACGAKLESADTVNALPGTAPQVSSIPFVGTNQGYTTLFAKMEAGTITFSMVKFGAPEAVQPLALKYTPAGPVFDLRVSNVLGGFAVAYSTAQGIFIGEIDLEGTLWKKPFSKLELANLPRAFSLLSEATEQHQGLFLVYATPIDAKRETLSIVDVEQPLFRADAIVTSEFSRSVPPIASFLDGLNGVIAYQGQLIRIGFGRGVFLAPPEDLPGDPWTYGASQFVATPAVQPQTFLFGATAILRGLRSAPQALILGAQGAKSALPFPISTELESQTVSAIVAAVACGSRLYTFARNKCERGGCTEELVRTTYSIRWNSNQGELPVTESFATVNKTEGVHQALVPFCAAKGRTLFVGAAWLDVGAVGGTKQKSFSEEASW
jgi:hypothetical protein